MAISKDQVIADNYADVVNLQTLAGVDTADLVNGIGVDDPGRPIGFKVPSHPEVGFGYYDIIGLGGFCAFPVPAVTGHQPRFVIDLVFPEDEIPQFRRTVDDAKIVIEIS